jgi:hypothetical protein
MEGEATGGVVGAVCVIVAAVTSRLLSITSAMRLRVELRALEMITGFRSLVLLLDDRLELGGCIPLIDLVSRLRF